jgi:rod shape-determining protein MreC
VTIGAERYGTRADTVVFLVCLVLSLVALALPEALRTPLAAGLRRTVLLPAVAVESQAASSREHRQNILALRAQRDSLALAATQVPELQAENAQLRALLQLRGRLATGFVTAEVLHQAGLTDGLTLLLSAGRDEGIVPLSPVVSPNGLLGMVIAVDVHTSVVMAWTHPDFRVSAMVRGGKIFGVVASRRGETAGEVMELRGVAYRDSLPPGTPVVTSGLGGVFPRGIPLGTVQGMLSESAGWERTYLLRPAAHPAQASHVLVLSSSVAGEEMEPAFDTMPGRSDTATAEAPSVRR